MDASSLLAFLLMEKGCEFVSSHLRAGLISAVNYSEVLTCTIDLGKPLTETIAEIGRLELSIVPHDAELAAIAASLRPKVKSLGLSFTDRSCLALGLSRQLPVLTGDRSWTQAGLDLEIILIR
ncbi:hypothetical protein FRUB_09759 [Fimbriiglobus ruber]|uniref:PIN domain-containing protein n=1 Tax=Fimbriiglobus ruber TaxID=1908690 RepID=A0A225DFQ4_9BACT|nr:hypothetical protein FRUB_09759 [Fimbriiglobus ruber]